MTLVDHGIEVNEIEAQFAISKAFFDLPPDVKKKIPHSKETNNGWEYKVGYVSSEVNVFDKIPFSGPVTTKHRSVRRERVFVASKKL